ncbi:MAG: hypothetical protein ACM31J_00620 [Nitrososphaerales archaeon]|jgi:tRNA threonylcarbamoyladenosine modification (KEOPS) complex  Pcc1 subunit
MKKSIVVHFAGNLDLARQIYQMLILEVMNISSLKSRDIEISEDETSIIISTEPSKLFLIKTIIKNKINEWFKKDPKLLEYKITEFENTIIVGKPVNLEKLTDFLSCEICGYKTLYEEDLFIHRYTHAGL